MVKSKQTETDFNYKSEEKFIKNSIKNQMKGSDSNGR